MAKNDFYFPHAQAAIIERLEHDPHLSRAWSAFINRDVFIGVTGNEFRAPRKLRNRPVSP